MNILTQVTSDIIDWSQELMPWQRMILARLLAAESLSDTDRSEIFKRAKIDYGFDSTDQPAPEIVLNPISPTAQDTGSVLRLTAIKDVDGVNALRPGQELKLGEQLTVIYGENGSGKSGYARILKKACSSK